MQWSLYSLKNDVGAIADRDFWVINITSLTGLCRKLLKTEWGAEENQHKTKIPHEREKNTGPRPGLSGSWGCFWSSSPLKEWEGFGHCQGTIVGLVINFARHINFACACLRGHVVPKCTKLWLHCM